MRGTHLRMTHGNSELVPPVDDTVAALHMDAEAADGVKGSGAKVAPQSADFLVLLVAVETTEGFVASIALVRTVMTRNPA